MTKLRDDKALASAWMDLEPALCDLRNAAGIAATLAEDATTMHKVGDKFEHTALHKQQAEQLLFAIYEVERRAKELKEAWYVGNGERG